MADDVTGLEREISTHSHATTFAQRKIVDYEREQGGLPEASEGASLRRPMDVVHAPDGDVVFADTENAVVRRIDQPTW